MCVCKINETDEALEDFESSCSSVLLTVVALVAANERVLMGRPSSIVGRCLRSLLYSLLVGRALGFSACSSHAALSALGIGLPRKRGALGRGCARGRTRCIDTCHAAQTRTPCRLPRTRGRMRVEQHCHRRGGRLARAEVSEELRVALGEHEQARLRDKAAEQPQLFAVRLVRESRAHARARVRLRKDSCHA